MILADVLDLNRQLQFLVPGKTTTTSLIASILESSNYDPIINGGIINGLDLNAKLGKGNWIMQS